MAVRFNSDASALKRTANLPGVTSFTLAGWFNFVIVTPARFWGAMGMMNAVDGVAGRTVASTASGSAQLSLEYTNAGGTFVTDALLTVSPATWYFIALSSAGSAIGNIAAYIRAQHEKAFTSITNSVAANSFTPGAVEFGREGFTGEFGDGDAFGLCAFDTALTSRELMLLSLDLLAEKPFRRAQPNFYWRLRGNNDLWDRSGNARHPTVTAGVDRPGIKTWPSRRKVLNTAAAAGAMSGTASWTWGQSGDLKGAGALSATVAWTWSQSGDLKGAGALAGTTPWTWSQSGALTGAGALAGAIAWQWSQSGSLAGSGALAGTIPWVWAQSGDLTNATPSGAITGTVSWTWGQSGDLKGTGALAATVAWTWSQSGTLIDSTSGAIAGTATWTWSATGTLNDLTPQPVSGVGGGLFYHYDEHRRRARREIEEIEERERDTREIQDELDRQIADLLRAQERQDARRAETARLQRLADLFTRRPLNLPPHVLESIERAAERRTYATLQRMQREILRMHQEEEAAVMAALMLDED